MKEDIWKEMEEDLRKKYKQTGSQKPLTAKEIPTATELLDMLEDSNPFKATFMFMKYAIKHFIKQMHKSNQN